jgi:hypothetical protein
MPTYPKIIWKQLCETKLIFCNVFKLSKKTECVEIFFPCNYNLFYYIFSFSMNKFTRKKYLYLFKYSIFSLTVYGTCQTEQINQSMFDVDHHTIILLNILSHQGPQLLHCLCADDVCFLLDLWFPTVLGCIYLDISCDRNNEFTNKLLLIRIH